MYYILARTHFIDHADETIQRWWQQVHTVEIY